MRESRSHASSARMAVGLMIGFYTFGFSLVALLLYVPSLSLFDDLLVAILFYSWALIILFMVVPWPEWFHPPGLRIERHEHPWLFRLIDEVAEATEQAGPSEVYLTFDATALVTERGGWLGIGSRRVLALGLPLLGLLNVAQLRAIVAHEFGHYHSGDTKLGPWIYRTRMSFTRTYRALFDEPGAVGAGGISHLLRKPFHWYVDTFMRITQSISRQGELMSDQIAVRIAGADAAISGLLRTHAANLVFSRYMSLDVVPVIQAGLRPPLVDGLLRYLAVPAVAVAISEAIEKERAEVEAGPLDSYPSLDERIAEMRDEGVAWMHDERVARMRVEPRPVSLAGSGKAISLLNDREAVEAALFRIKSSVAREGYELTFVPWEDVAREVWHSTWQATVNNYAAVLSGITPSTIPETKEIPGLFASRIVPAVRHEMSNAQRADHAVGVLEAGIAVALLRDGWQVTANPGEQFNFSKAGETCQPVPAIARLISDPTAADDWVALVSDLGIADVDLGGLAKVDTSLAVGARASGVDSGGAHFDGSNPSTANPASPVEM